MQTHSLVITQFWKVLFQDSFNSVHALLATVSAKTRYVQKLSVTSMKRWKDFYMSYTISNTHL